MAQIEFHKVATLPTSPSVDALYFVQAAASTANGNRGNLYATDSSGNYHQITPPNGSTFSDEMKSFALGYSGTTGGQTPRVGEVLADIQRDKIGYFTGLVPLPTPVEVAIRYRTAEHPNAVSTDHSSTITAVSTTHAGVMTAADKVKLDSLVANYKGVYQNAAALNTAHVVSSDGDWAIVVNTIGPAQHYSWDANSNSWEAVDFASITGTTNLGYIPSGGVGTITSDTGNNAVIPLVDGVNAGLMSPASLATLTANVNAIAAINDTDDQTSEEVSTPAIGNLVGVTVAAQLAELENEKVHYTNSSVTVDINPGESIQDGINSLSKYHFSGDAKGVVRLMDGVHTLPSQLALYNRHPQGQLISIVAQSPITNPIEADFTGVKATDELMLRGKSPVQVNCPGGFLICSGNERLSVVGIGIFSGGSGVGIKTEYGGDVLAVDCILHGFFHSMFASESSLVRGVRVAGTHTLHHGMVVYYGSVGDFSDTLVMYSNVNGMYAFNFSLLKVQGTLIKGSTTGQGFQLQLNSSTYSVQNTFKDIAGRGVYLALGSSLYSYADTFQDITYEAYFSTGSSVINVYDPIVNTNVGVVISRIVDIQNASQGYLQSVSGSGVNGMSCRLYYQANAIEAGTHGTGIVFSPAVNVTGNDGSKWR